MSVNTYYSNNRGENSEKSSLGLLLKILWAFIVGFLLLLYPLQTSAKVISKCTNCHTMHDSEEGASVTAGNPQPALMNLSEGSSCWGCHAVGGSNNIDPLTGAPQVNHTAANDLAGGNFAYITGAKNGVTGTTETRGHNVIITGVVDDNFGSAYPPGDEFSQISDGFTMETFTCAGTFGCHGDRSVQDENQAISGAHHANDAALKYGTIDESFQGSTVGTSYRFLLGVKGGEDTDWQATESASDHNEYKGMTSGVESTRIFPGSNSISGFCAECHGNFHGEESDIGTGGLWRRHPTDISLPGDGTEYAAYTSYSVEVPVARISIPNAPGSSIDPNETTDDIVMCLSCHRAHASPNRDSLRWNYEEMIAGGGGSGGCFTCHTSKK